MKHVCSAYIYISRDVCVCSRYVYIINVDVCIKWYLISTKEQRTFTSKSKIETTKFAVKRRAAHYSKVTRSTADKQMNEIFFWFSFWKKFWFWKFIWNEIRSIENKIEIVFTRADRRRNCSKIPEGFHSFLQATKMTNTKRSHLFAIWLWNKRIRRGISRNLLIVFLRGKWLRTKEFHLTSSGSYKATEEITTACGNTSRRVKKGIGIRKVTTLA